ncbi:uncharacterized protein LOC119740002 isoform X2 [Patiria miniata]|uniref:PH domain-containing protein n=1 Tax=Patiria miniata TaxID=46514 RepID=A0A914B4W4_PATMI|nr:uncharacterized protein LOC119740002 isoform X2 [Patiria miniata]
MEREQPKAFADTEHIHSGYLTLGEQVHRKDGTQISFKDKNKRFYVLRCFGHKFLTLSGYKNIKEYKAPSGSQHKTVEQISVSKDAKIHSMLIPAKKHKNSHVLGILQDKDMTYLEADSSDELTAWCNAFDDVFIRLGWKEPPPPSPTPPPSPLSPPPGLESQDGKVPSQRRRKPLPSRGSALDLFQSQEPNRTRFSSPPAGSANRNSGDEEFAFNFDRPRSTEAEFSKITHSYSDGTEHIGYVNLQKNVSPPAWLENTPMHQERVVDVSHVRYINLRGKQDHEELVHPGPPPSLPPRGNLHRIRGNTCPGFHLTNHDSPDDRSPRNSGGFEDGIRPARSESVHTPPAPKISVTEAPPMSPLLTNKRFLHLQDDSDAMRKVSLPQPLNLKPRRVGVVVPPAISPPDSPAALRKAGSYSNVSLNLSNRPLPSPVHGGDSFDVHTLRWEIGHKDGFPVVLKKSELDNALGLVRIADYVWVAGWKAGKSEVAKKLHVGDQLRQINEQIVVDPSVTNTLFATSAVDEILLVIRRLPHAKVRNLHRSSVNESWGLEVEGNRVVNVSKSGPAAEAKLTTRAQGAFSERLCDWIITEIDGEPVSLLSKRDQVKNRMDNAGLQMALVIQPDDFIKRLNAELQKVKFAHEYFVGSN